MMRLFIITRWGNPYEEDGPDGKDTNFLVCASSLDEAAKIVDNKLSHMTTVVSGNRPVQDFSHCATEIGEELLSQEPAIIHGPWIESMIIRNSSHYPSWHRQDPDGEWTSTKELFD